MTDDKAREGQLARIRALMQRTTANGCTEAEAEAAAATVDRLLAQYEINLDDVSVRSQEVTQFEVEAMQHAVRHSAMSIGAFCDCKVWTSSPNIVFLGLEIDTEVAEYLVMLFMRAIDREAGQFVVFNAEYSLKDRLGKANMLTSYKIGMAVRLGERLQKLKSSRDFTAKTSGFDLVVAKDALVKQAFATLGIHLTRGGSGGSIRDPGAYNAGRAAADGVAISQGVGKNAATSAGRLR